ncbi:MAG: phage baseplate protein [Butyricicoccus sp.]
MAETIAKGIKFSEDEDTYLFAPTMNQIYPVGSIYFSMASTNPATLFGMGTWQQIAAGRFLIGAGGGFSVGDAGGADKLTDVPAHTHSFSANSTTNSAGAHTHKLYLKYNENIAISTSASGNRVTPAPNGTNTSDAAYTTESGGSHNHTVSVSGTTASTGATEGVSILPPYLAVYMWQRTA